MKSLFLTAALLFTVAVFAQVPQGISYQAIAFTSSGTPVVNGNVGVKISILDNSSSGTVVYSETHTKPTNAQGLFNLNIGQGSATIGAFSLINWSTNSKFLKVEIDPNGGTSYSITGSSQLMSVPFALVAGSIGSSQGNSLSTQLIQSKTTSFAFDDYNDNKVYAFCSFNGVWSSQVYDQNTTVTIEETRGNFGFDDYNGNKVYVFNGTSGQWSSQSYNGNTTVTLELDTLLGNFSFDDYNSNVVYSYSASSGTWSSQTYNGSTTVTLKSSKGNLAFDDYNANRVYVYNGVTGQWSSQTYNSNTTVTIHESNGSFIFDDYNDSKVYIFSALSGTWSSQLYNSNSTVTIEESEID